MIGMSTGDAAVGFVIIIGFFSVLAGCIVFAAAVIVDLTERWQRRAAQRDVLSGRPESSEFFRPRYVRTRRP